MNIDIYLEWQLINDKYKLHETLNKLKEHGKTNEYDRLRAGTRQTQGSKV